MMKASKAVLIFACVFVFSLESWALPKEGIQMGPEWRLRKLSIHLRGFTPSIEEYQALNQAKASDEKTLESFFSNKSLEYVNSREYIGKTSEWITSLFRFKGYGLPSENYFSDIAKEQVLPKNELPLIYTYPAPASPLNSTDGLFREMLQRNLSWDTLLLGSSYRAYPSYSYDSNPPSLLEGTSDDYDFLTTLLASKAMTKTELKSLRHVLLAPAIDEDPRLAGAITTKRFFSRYVNTNTNKNRRRAAAMFNIFLCDNMRPVSIPDDSEDRRFVNQSLGQMSEHGRAMTLTGESRHASDKACASCHYKLDPMASIFEGFGSSIPLDLTTGALIYRIASNPSLAETSVNVPVQSLRQMGQAVISQHEYEACQITHFWDWMMGSDVELTPERQNQLIALFNAKGRKVNDFVAALANEPEFYAPPAVLSPAVVAYRRIQKNFQDCMTCHRSDEGPSADFTKFPIGGTPEKHERWLKRIAASLDLKNDGKDATMPPDWSGWDNSYKKEVNKNVRSWLCMGAPDSNGIPTAKEFGETLCK